VPGTTWACKHHVPVKRKVLLEKEILSDGRVRKHTATIPIGWRCELENRPDVCFRSKRMELDVAPEDISKPLTFLPTYEVETQLRTRQKRSLRESIEMLVEALDDPIIQDMEEEDVEHMRKNLRTMEARARDYDC